MEAVYDGGSKLRHTFTDLPRDAYIYRIVYPLYNIPISVLYSNTLSTRYISV